MVNYLQHIKSESRRQTMTQYRQGDILFIKVPDKEFAGRPATAVKGRYVIAEGEVTGHNHTVVADERTELSTDEDFNSLFLKVSKPTAVVHQTHDPVTLEPGTYKIAHQREESPERVIQPRAAFD